MPTYDYRCTKCQHEFEINQSIIEKSLTECPKCAGQVQRLICKNVGIAFKGSGFYVTDKDKSSTNSPCSSGKCNH